MELRVDSHLWVLGDYRERYVPHGYFSDMDIGNKLEIMSKIEGLDGLFIFYPPDPLPSDPEKLIKKLADFGLVVSNLSTDNFTNRKWKNGAFVDSDKKIRNENIKLCKEAIDFSKEVKAHSVLLWPAHDGFDYPFQVNYRDGWKYIVETIKEIGEHDKETKIALEYKSKDPRQKQYLSNMGKALALINDIDLPNIGVALDIGHAFMAGESLAESLEILDMHNKLYQIHLNENYKDADPDLIFGTINFWEILEFFYYLEKTNFNGWSIIDMISSRDDRAKSLELAVKLTWKYKRLAEKLIRHSDEINKNLKGYHFADNMDLIQSLVL